MADPILFDSRRSSEPRTKRQWFIDDFRVEKAHLMCVQCRAIGLESRSIATNGSERMCCPACHSDMPLGYRVDLKQSRKKTRKDYPHGETLDDVWARFDNRCVVCSAPKDFLLRMGIAIQRQHVAEYAKHGHQGPLVPMCAPCHENATQRQKLFWFWYRQVSPYVKSVSGSRPELPRDGVASDSLPTEEQDSTRQLEGLPDHDALH